VARKAKYTTALPVYVAQSVRDRINKIATEEELSLAQVLREIIDIGLPAREKRGQD
jgi:hypothetical protein